MVAFVPRFYGYTFDWFVHYYRLFPSPGYGWLLRFTHTFSQRRSSLRSWMVTRSVYCWLRSVRLYPFMVWISAFYAPAIVGSPHAPLHRTPRTPDAHTHTFTVYTHTLPPRTAPPLPVLLVTAPHHCLSPFTADSATPPLWTVYVTVPLPFRCIPFGLGYVPTGSWFGWVALHSHTSCVTSRLFTRCPTLAARLPRTALPLPLRRSRLAHLLH